MSKQILSEQTTLNRSVSLVESVKPNPGCLGTIYGICADYKNKTRNGNFYSRKLWENVFNDSLVKESLEDRILFGELGHPQDNRLETDIAKTCIVMTDYEFDDNEGVIKGHFDILDTPCGRIFKSLLDYGCRCGLSSRGEGDVVEEGGQNNIDEDTYYFVAFDAVALPAVQKAKPSLQESIKRETLKESIRHQVESISNKSVLDTVKKVIETTKLPEMDSLMESINNKANELEGITGSSNLIDDLANLTRKYEELKQDNIKLKESVITYKDRLRKAVKSCKDSNESSARETKTFDESLQQKDLEISKFRAKLREANSRYIEMKEQNTALEERYNRQLERVKSSNDRRLSDMRQSYEEKIASLEESYSSKIEMYKTRIADTNTSLNESISGKEEQIDALNETINGLKEQIKELESARYTQETEQTSLNENLNNQLKTANSKVADSNTKLQKLSKSYNDLLESYVALKSQVSGVSRDIIKESTKPNSTAKEVDSLVESIVDKSDRYRSMSSLSDPLFSTTDKKTLLKQKGNDGNDELRSFMAQVTKIL